MEIHKEKRLHSSSLPIILVSAYDIASANVLISDITSASDENANEKDILNKPQSKIWHIVNKYYEVNVELYPVADNDTIPLSLADRLESHIIYITDDEENELVGEQCEERWARAGGAGVERAAVRLAVAACVDPPAALAAWARRRGYEPVALAERAPTDHCGDDDYSFPDTYGIDRVRAALHAHTWRGLRRLDQPPPSASAPSLQGALDVTSSDEEYSGVAGEEEEEEWAEEAVERAEAFVAALGAVGEVRVAAGASAGEGEAEEEERRARAERLVRAFCRALGADLHAL